MNTYRNESDFRDLSRNTSSLLFSGMGSLWESASFPVALNHLLRRLEQVLDLESLVVCFEGTTHSPPLIVRGASESPPPDPAVREQVRHLGERLILEETGEGSRFRLCMPLPARPRALGTLSASVALEHRKSAIETLDIVVEIVAAQWVALCRLDQLHARYEAEMTALRQMLGHRIRIEGILGNSDEMEAIRAQITALAPQEDPVLLTGEQGTGKDLTATALHLLGRGDHAPFRKVLFTGPPSSGPRSPLLEPDAMLRGLDHGTLYLEDIARAPEPVWEWLKTGALGSVRLIAAMTNRPSGGSHLPDEVLDIFARGQISLPSLRDRPGDIPLLAGHFAERHLQAQDPNSAASTRISTAALEQMLAYPWPGNVRELRETVAIALDQSGDRVVHGRCLPPALRAPETSDSGHGTTLPSSVHLLEKDLILDGLERNHGNVAGTARLLGITPRMLRYRMEKLGIETYLRSGRRPG